MRLQVLPFRLAIAQLPAGSALPDWAQAAELWSVTRTPEELSLVCSESQVPSDATANRGWQALQVIGPLDFSLTGVIASLTAPLASCGISVFVLSTFATDYILVKAEAVSQAVCALQEAGHEIAG